MAEEDNNKPQEESHHTKTLVVEAGVADEIKVIQGGSDKGGGGDPMKSILFLAVLAIVAVMLFFGWSLFVRLSNPQPARTNTVTNVDEDPEPISGEVPLNELGE